MDARFSPEQRALRESAAQVVDRLGPKAVADLDDSDRTSKLEAAVATAGWRELRDDVGDGSPLASAVEAAIVAEELGRGLADVAYLGPLLAADLARRAGLDEASGLTIALSADLGALAASGDADTAVAFDASAATAAILLEETADGHRLLVADVRDHAPHLDLTRRVGTIDAGGVAALPQAVAIDRDALTAWTAFGLAVACADLVGVMRGAVRLSTDYASVRRQYGHTIGSFQAVQHLLADALVATEGSYSAALYAAWAVDALPPDEALDAARVAKAYCGRAARVVGETAVQVHGGIGNTWDCLAHVYLRRALLTTAVLGGTGASLTHVLSRHGIEGGFDGLR
ncbi:MAG: acyl-CoA dehydrogenase family protein [Microbacterium sp.]